MKYSNFIQMNKRNGKPGNMISSLIGTWALRSASLLDSNYDPMTGNVRLTATIIYVESLLHNVSYSLLFLFTSIIFATLH